MNYRNLFSKSESISTLSGRAIASLTCFIGFPVHLLICAAIRFNDGGPALYRCFRLGKSGRAFQLFKYRSMKVNAPHLMSSGFKMIVETDDPRVTPIGRWIRSGIDELAQAWNIVRGEMTWIGPRPDPAWMLPLYGPVCRQRLSVLPGITGFAQVLDSRNLSTPEGFALDIWYISHRTFLLDTWIVLVTPFFMLGRRSIGHKLLTRLRALPEVQETKLLCEEELNIGKPFLPKSPEIDSCFSSHAIR
jgi:lipopolysaccharide/colanic/teichoic acid biosynthesis glycosyltransferase